MEVAEVDLEVDAEVVEEKEEKKLRNTFPERWFWQRCFPIKWADDFLSNVYSQKCA